ncbi:hypothetical protein L1049_017481 [Liquidambar formosana]|uniref:Leucine-rich repeat-containing N-terminal plant-type domain-containing protein n=1 Tax=Liquidambar formosana TaxID=63359 RepID=A0AAP0S7V8_LIQFO
MGVSLVACNGGWEEETSALLQLKASINHPNGTSLTSWVEGNDTSASDCCRWIGVMCSNTSGRVIKLYLGASWWDLGDWFPKTIIQVEQSGGPPFEWQQIK